MADKNRISRRSTEPGIHRITSMKVADLTNSLESVSVVMTSKRTVAQPDDKSEALRLKEATANSPWVDTRLGDSFANKSLRTRKLKDPIEELKLFTDSITRG